MSIPFEKGEIKIHKRNDHKYELEINHDSHQYFMVCVLTKAELTKLLFEIDYILNE